MKRFEIFGHVCAWRGSDGERPGPGSRGRRSLGGGGFHGGFGGGGFRGGFGGAGFRGGFGGAGFRGGGFGGWRGGGLCWPERRDGWLGPWLAWWRICWPELRRGRLGPWLARRPPRGMGSWLELLGLGIVAGAGTTAGGQPTRG